MKKQLEIEIKVGLFVAIGTGLLMLAILVLGSTENLFSRSNKYKIHFTSVEGLIPGAKVVLSGMAVGSVEDIDLDSGAQNILVTVSVARKYADWVRKNSEAEMATQGVLGDKYIMITPGDRAQEQVPNEAEIPQRPSKDLSQFLNRGDQLMISLNSISQSLDRLLKTLEAKGRSEALFSGLAATAQNLAAVSSKLNAGFNDAHFKGIIRNLNGITEKVNNGTGTLGALINDPGLYDDAKALMGGANRNRILRNLVRQTMKDNKEGEPVAEPSPAPKKK